MSDAQDSTHGGGAAWRPAGAAGAAPVVQPAAGLSLAVIGAGPAGLALALLAAGRLPDARITLFDARERDADVAGDPRTIALSLGSVQLLRRLGAWPAAQAEPILEVQVSQQGTPWRLLGAEPEVRIRAAEEGVEMLGAVLSHGRIVDALQRAWFAAAEREPARLASRFGAKVSGLKKFVDAVEVDAGIAERFDLAVVAEGGVFDPRSTAAAGPDAPPAWRHDYGQAAWVGQVTLEGARRGVAFERFTRNGPVALLPLPASGDGPQRAALIWCVDASDDPVAPLTDAQRLAVLGSLLHEEAGTPVAIGPLKCFPLGLHAQRTLVDGRSVRIGNAAQTLHPVAGQGLNLGLRDAFELVDGLARSSAGMADIERALARLERRRAPDRYAMIATTDFLARGFTWELPGLATARGLGLAALQAARPLKSLLARQMMYGRR